MPVMSGHLLWGLWRASPGEPVTPLATLCLPWKSPSPALAALAGWHLLLEPLELARPGDRI